MSEIYLIVNKINGKLYVGQTSINFKKRWTKHINSAVNSPSKGCVSLYRAIRKYGKDNFIFECIEETEDLDNREIHWINEYGGINSDLNYNFKDPLSMKWSDYTRVKQSKSMIGADNPNYGNKWSQEQKDEASKKNKGIVTGKQIGRAHV